MGKDRFTVDYDDCIIYIYTGPHGEKAEGDVFDSFEEAKAAVIRYQEFILQRAKDNLRLAKKLKEKDCV